MHDNNLDVISGEKHNGDVVQRFRKLINENLVIDSWRHLHPNEKMYSWRRGNIARRLDYILIGEDIIQYLDNASINSIGFSDHLLTSATLKFNNFKYGKSYYKMNVSILQDKEYVSMMKTKIPKIIIDNKNLDSHLQWEMTKKEIKELTVKYCKKRAFERGERKRNIKSSLDLIEKLIADSPNSEKLINEQNELKMKWEELLAEETWGNQIRSGIKWIEEGEKCSKFFLALVLSLLGAVV